MARKAAYRVTFGHLPATREPMPCVSSSALEGRWKRSLASVSSFKTSSKSTIGIPRRVLHAIHCIQLP